jgi:hypothetical protein
MASKSAKPEIPADMWLHVAADALARYAAAGGIVEVVAETTNVVIVLPIAPDDPRLPDSFTKLIVAPERVAPGDPTS